MFRILDYVGTTSTYNEFGRVIIRTPNGVLNQTLIELALVNGIRDDLLKNDQSKLDISDRVVTKDDIIHTLSKSTRNVFCIKKNINGHYKFQVICENKEDAHILVLIDTNPRNVNDLSSIGILTPCKSTREFVHSITNPETEDGVGTAVIEHKHILYDFKSFKLLVKKFGIGTTDESTLGSIARRNAFDNNQTFKTRGIVSKVRRGINIGRRGFKQYVMNESASMSQTNVRSNPGPSLGIRLRNWIRRPNQPNSS